MLPQRVVTQMVKSAPSTDTDHYCPRHSVGVLRELPEPWDLPVVAAVRMSAATPGLLRAVPLHTIDEAAGDATRVACARTGSRTAASPPTCR